MLYDGGRRPSYGAGGAAPVQQFGAPARPGASATSASAAGAGGGASRQIPLRPVTIRMIIDAQRIGEGTLTISGAEVGHVTVVGRVLESTMANDAPNTAKHHTYRLSDGTGAITVKHWLDPTTVVEAEKPGNFIAATGTVRQLNGEPTLSGSVRSMADQNELTFHFLDVINTHLRYVQGDRLPAGAKETSSPSKISQRPNMNAAHTFASASGNTSEALQMAIHNVLTSERSRSLTAAEIFELVKRRQPAAVGHSSIYDVERLMSMHVDEGFCHREGNKYFM